jgi:hypothetical protein
MGIEYAPVVFLSYHTHEEANREIFAFIEGFHPFLLIPTHLGCDEFPRWRESA